MPREHFKSRLGFILISAGCAIGLGNVWRFPYVVGEYGGAAFVLLYLIFLAILGIPILVMELAVGRASQRSVAQAFDRLEPPKTKWHYFKWVALAGQYLLMMFYTTVAGWMLSYIPKMATANLATMDAAGTNMLFNTMLANPVELVFWMFLACAIALFVCHLGLQKGVERVTKVLMVCLLALIAVLVVRSVTLEGAGAGIAFYLNPDFSKIFASPSACSDAVFAALGQAFFTLSIGLGSMEIFGSYINKKHALPGEAVRIAGLDTFVALATGFIIFPACFAFGVAPDSGPGLVFVTLPAVFSQMWMGGLFATLFFVFMSFAAHLDAHRSLRSHHELLDGPVELQPQQSGSDQCDPYSVALIALRAWLQRVVGRRASRYRQHPSHRRLRGVEQSAHRWLAGVYALLRKQAWLGMEKFFAGSEHGRWHAFPQSALLLGEVRYPRTHYRSTRIGLGAAHLKLAFGISPGTAFHANIKTLPQIEAALSESSSRLQQTYNKFAV